MKNSVNRSNPGAPSQQGCLHFRLAETSSLRSEVTRVFRFVTLVVEEVLKQLDPLDHLIYGSTSSRHHSLFKLTFGLKTGSTSLGGKWISQALTKIPLPTVGQDVRAPV